MLQVLIIIIIICIFARWEHTRTQPVYFAIGDDARTESQVHGRGVTLSDVSLSLLIFFFFLQKIYILAASITRLKLIVYILETRKRVCVITTKRNSSKLNKTRRERVCLLIFFHSKVKYLSKEVTRR